MQAGIAPDVFWSLTLRELSMVLEAKQLETYRLWDVARTVGMWTLSPHTKKKLRPRDLLDLPIDAAQDRKPSFDKYKEILQRIQHGQSDASS